VKQGEGRDLAHELYVYQQMTFEEIARRIGRSDKTVRVWADEGNWREERERDLTARQNVHEKLHVLVQKITDRMILDCEKDNELSPQSLHALTNLLAALNRAYKYEMEDAKADDTTEKQVLSPEDIVSRVREILGA
jgi:predicted transcriptional regulator